MRSEVHARHEGKGVKGDPFLSPPRRKKVVGRGGWYGGSRNSRYYRFQFRPAPKSKASP
jgi:hypothetical protein